MFKTNHPFLCNMEYFFETSDRFYFIMPFISGGEMNRIFKELRNDTFSEKQIKFYITQVLLGLKELHSN